MELFKLVDRPSDIDPMSTAGETPSSVEGVVEFHNVNFNYPTRPDTKVLEGFSLRVPAGKVTALVVQPSCPYAWNIKAKTYNRARADLAKAQSLA